MKHSEGSDLPIELRQVAERLTHDRPEPTPAELDRIKVRAIRRAARTRTSTDTKGAILTSRVGLVVILALGLMMTGTGATLAVTGLPGQDDSAESQYAAPDDQGGGGVLGEEDDVGGVEDDVGGVEDDVGGVAGEAAEPTAGGEEPVVQAQDQVAAGEEGDQLPFTGLVIVPLLLGGVALIGTGLLLRRRVDRA